MIERRIRSEGGPKARPPYNKKLFDDFVYFSQRQYDCLDYDPFHPMIVHLGRGLPREEFLWLSILYMAFYNIGSAWVAFRGSTPLKPLPGWMERLPVGVQRRNLRGGKVRAHLASVAKLSRQHGSLHGYLTKGFTGDPKKDWDHLSNNLGKAWGNGRWSIFTTAELIQKANKLPVLPCHIMNENSSGPRAGLMRMYGLKGDPPVEKLDALADELFAAARARLKTKIFYLPKGHYDHGMLESQLCDFQSLCKGRYYIGRDIDRDQERIDKAYKLLVAANKKVVYLDEVWEAREAVFDKRYLGEFQGWLGRTEDAKTYYKKTGRVADHKEIREQLGFLF